jgi:hypothetical protein
VHAFSLTVIYKINEPEHTILATNFLIKRSLMPIFYKRLKLRIPAMISYKKGLKLSWPCLIKILILD